MLELSLPMEFDSARDEEFFAALPAQPGILLLHMKNADAQPYLARTADIRSAAQRLLRAPESPSKRLNLRNVAGGIRYRVSGSKFEQMFALYELARECFPEKYGEIMRLKPPALLKINLRNNYPRCYVTRRLGPGGFYFGPFASRKAADAFCEAFLDLFKVRRCKIKIRRDPEFPGCIYSEMKICLAPCFAGCTKEEYDAEVERMRRALETAGASLTDELSREREAASAALNFERAALVHKRIEKASSTVKMLPDLARRIDQIHAVILQRGIDRQTVIVFPILAGFLREPIILPFDELSSAPRSVEAILRAGLEPPAQQNTAQNGSEDLPENLPAHLPPQLRVRAPGRLSEHLSLIARWFYSNPREGEILFREAEWPYRRILRACGRILTSAKVPEPAPPSSTSATK